MNKHLYAKNPKHYEKLVDDLYQQHPEITLPPEYAYFTRDNLLQFMIRLARYKFVARQLRPRDHILEIGCGSGLGALFLAQHSSRVTAIDVKTQEIAEANSINRRNNATFEVADFFEYDPKLEFDVIVMLDVIEHMEENLGRKMIQRTTRFLADDGMLIVGTPSCYSAEYQSPLSRAAHIKLYDQQELREMMETWYGRTLAFSMNDEMVHTGFAKLAWYYFVLAFIPKNES
ncbi:MAG: class I SAM-dependent methyltransferase [Sedimentisphaerales bacterium]|nr:class I SAM-dependent methyltransferase [Sedimentisphaerales bacterium]